LIDWISLIVLVLQLVNKMLTWAAEQRAITLGQQQEIARETLEILRKAGVAKDVLSKIDGMSDADVDDLLHRLEPREPPGK
jgi:hypothetical protein